MKISSEFQPYSQAIAVAQSAARTPGAPDRSADDSRAAAQERLRQVIAEKQTLAQDATQCPQLGSLLDLKA